MLSLWDSQLCRLPLERASLRPRCQTSCGRPVSSQGLWHGFPCVRKGRCGCLLAEGPQVSPAGSSSKGRAWFLFSRARVTLWPWLATAFLQASVFLPGK